MDQATGILAYIQAKHPDRGYGADGVMNELMKAQLRPEDVPQAIACNVQAIAEISAKSIPTTFNVV